jgi:hypothetical protein
VRVGRVGEELHGRHVFHVPVAGDADEGAPVCACACVCGRGGWDGVHPGGGGLGEVDGFQRGPARGEEGVAVVVC